jgi:hypothetical protein
LSGWWSFNNNANDASLNANNGTVTGATLTTDRFGKANSAYSFDGILNKIEVADNTSLKFQSVNKISIALWFKMKSSSGSTGAVFFIKQSGVGTTQQGINFGLVNGNNDLVGIVKNGSSGIQSFLPTPSSSYTNDIWHHLVYVFDGGLAKIYLDNVLVVSSNVVGSVIGDNVEKLIFGTGNIGNVYYFKGILDDIGIWNRVLTQDEITNLYFANICYQNITVTDTLVINTSFLGFNPVTYNSTVTIYPNPAKDYVTIDCGNIANVIGYNIKIYNELGQIVFTGPMNKQQYSVPLNTWTGKGLYLVKIYDASNNVVNTRKIILQ